MDEVIREIDDSQNKVDILKVLALKLKEGILKTNISKSTSNIRITIALNNETQKRKVFFTYYQLPNNYIGIFKCDLEVNGNGDLKYDMIMLGRSGYNKD